MDVLSHGLWGGIAFGRRSRRDYLWAFGLSLLPDVLGEGVMFGVAALAGMPLPSAEHGHPNITEFPLPLQQCYNATHSLAVFAALFLVVWAVRRRPFLPLAAWGLHILIDIPTHSLALFPTPFLWPFSDLKVDGIPWHTPTVLIPNILLLLGAYVWWWRVRRGWRGADVVAKPRTER
jgi:membrane-bound metal-dependent hydrolase YbcI (DUF457 family)